MTRKLSIISGLILFAFATVHLISPISQFGQRLVSPAERHAALRPVTGDDTPTRVLGVQDSTLSLWRTARRPSHTSNDNGSRSRSSTDSLRTSIAPLTMPRACPDPGGSREPRTHTGRPVDEGVTGSRQPLSPSRGPLLVAKPRVGIESHQCPFCCY